MNYVFDRNGSFVVQGDAIETLEGMASMPGIQFDAIITDPPYALSLGVDDVELAGRAPMRRDFGDWDEDWTPGPFLDLAARLLRPGGSLLAFTSDRLLSAYREHRTFKALGTLVWVKTNPAPSPRPGYVQATEWIVWLQRHGGPATWNGRGYTTNVLEYPAPSAATRTHPNEKPEQLMRRLIQTHTNAGDRILDPYCGSGTTLAAGKALGRLVTGIERDETYALRSASRLAQEVLL